VRLKASLCLTILVSLAAGSARAQSDDAKIKAEVERQLKELEGKKWTAGVNPKGGGVFVRSPDGDACFRLYGYAQPTMTATVDDHNQAWGNLDFRIRRARIDFSADYGDRYKLFLEYDGAPSDGTSLVEAWTQAAYAKDRHYVRFGKFVSPFSTEDLRSSRSLLTVERYAALNALFGLPAVDVQIGPMLWGYVDSGKRLMYQLALFNGNASAGATVSNGSRGNARDNNRHKELQARVNVKVCSELTVGGAFDFDREGEQTLAISSYSGARFASTSVMGDRVAGDFDAHWAKGRWNADAEWLVADFPDADATLHGGYVMAAFWADGDEGSGGVQPILRADYAEIMDAVQYTSIEGEPTFFTPTIASLTGGANLWFDGRTRLQLNAILEHVNGAGNGVYTGDARWRPVFLSQFQVKF